MDIVLRTTCNGLKTASNLILCVWLVSDKRATMILVADKNTGRKIPAKVTIKAARIHVETPPNVSRPPNLERVE